jgi:hypothetical protein
MSTKNLARTIIEGGRHRGNKWDRRNSHAIERAHLNNYLKEVEHDPENYYDSDPEPIQHVGKGFDDKLGPIYRWLRRQVGRPWDAVRADIAQAFDIRTTAGRHIVFDHMLQSVQTGPETGYHYYSVPGDSTAAYSDHEYYVDDDGILQKKRYLGRRYRSEKVPPFDTRQLSNWLNGRIVGKVGNKFFWFTPTGKAKKHKGAGHDHIWRTVWDRQYNYFSYYDRSHGPYFQYLSYDIVYKLDGNGVQVLDPDGKPIVLDRTPKWVNANYTPTLRQHRKLNEKEMAYWHTIPTYYQTLILEKSPNYPKPPKEQNRYYY